jgi:hypothetical protein
MPCLTVLKTSHFVNILLFFINLIDVSQQVLEWQDTADTCSQMEGQASDIHTVNGQMGRCVLFMLQLHL